MHHKKMILASAFWLLSNAVYAGFAQEATFCLEIKDNTSPYVFYGSFVSSDFFDDKHFVGKMRNGKNCVTHLYHHGPKKYKLALYFVGTADGWAHVSITPDSSCGYLRNVSKILESTFQKTGKAKETWEFVLHQTKANHDSFTYQLSCMHKGE